MILLASTMDGLDLSRSRVMVAAVQSLAFYCFPLLTGPAVTCDAPTRP